MFLKRFTFLAFFATIFTSASAQQLDATFDLVRFKASDSQNMVELYCSVNGNSVVYKKVSGGYQAVVALELQISDSTGVKYFDKLNLKSPLVADTAGLMAPFNLQKRYFLKNGNYKFAGKAKDVNSAKPGSDIEVPLSVNFDKSKVEISDIQLLESYEKSVEKNDYTKSGMKLVSYVSSFYPKGFDRLKFYLEIYNTEAVVGKDKSVVVFYRLVPTRDNMAKLTIGGQKVQKTAPVNVFMQDVDISTVASGNYELFIEVRNAENKTIASQRRFIQRSNPAEVNPDGTVAAATPRNESAAGFFYRPGFCQIESLFIVFAAIIEFGRRQHHRIVNQKRNRAAETELPVYFLATPFGRQSGAGLARLQAAHRVRRENFP